MLGPPGLIGHPPAVRPAASQEPLFDFLYDKICEDRGHTLDTDYGSEMHRERIGRELAACNIFRTPGPRASLKQ